MKMHLLPACRLPVTLICLSTLLGSARSALGQSLEWSAVGLTNDRLRQMASIDDLDGDGFRDLMVSTNEGVIRVLSGATGLEIHSFPGNNVASAGDVNNDGQPDLLVSESDNQGNRTTRVYSGELGVVDTIYQLSVPSGETGEFGSAFDGVGDLDGDGWDDFVLGNHEASPGGLTNAGGATVFSGQTGAVMFQFNGTVAGDRLGYKVASAGDVNNDGTPDVLVAAGDFSGLRAFVYVYSGSDGALLHTFEGTNFRDVFGFQVAGAGDLNDDGHDDVMVGAQLSYGTFGATFVFSGLDGTVLHYLYHPVQPGQLWAYLASAGDVDGDGAPDIMIGAPGTDANTGVARIYSGRTGAMLMEISGANEGESLGGLLAGMGDLNGDGLHDFAIGSADAATGLIQAFTSPQPGPAPDANQSEIAASAAAVDFLGESTITMTPKNALGQILGTGHTVYFKATGGAMLGGVIDNGDGSYSQVVQVGASATTCTVAAAVNGRLIAATAIVTATAAQSLAAAEQETLTLGSIWNSDYLDTASDDYTFETLREGTVITGGHGKNQTGYSALDQMWQLYVPPGMTAVFYVKAFGDLRNYGGNTSDEFRFSWAPNLSTNFTPMVIVDRTFVEGGFYRKFPLPSGTNGWIDIRVEDTDHENGHDSNGGLVINHLGVAVIGGPLSAPTAPSGLAASASSSSVIDLTWTDNSSNEAGFDIYRSLDGTNWSATPTASVLANTTSYSDVGLLESTEYYYRATAVNSTGSSLASNTVSATTNGPGVPTDNVANADIAVAGTVSGNYVGTTTNGGASESITERQSGGKPANRYSYLEHQWSINVVGGSSVVFWVKANHSVSTDFDDFMFSYSTDGSNFTDMMLVTSTVNDPLVYESCTLPAWISGTVYIRVKDTVRSPGTTSLDTLYVDHMFIRSSSN